MVVKSRRLNRKLVLAQAAQLADAAGDVQGVTLAALAQALEIRAPSLYNHVAGLEDLHYGLAVYGVRQLLAELRQAAQGKVGRAAILDMAAAYRGFARTHPGLYPLTLRAPEADQAELMALAQEFLQLLQLVMASLGLEGDEAIHAIRGLRAILHGFAALEAVEGYKMALNLDESFRRLVDVYLDGLVRADATGNASAPAIGVATSPQG
ncbi:MAG: TetR-like C-terminal domain-containing protein [Litorilinea sp.]